VLPLQTPAVPEGLLGVGCTPFTLIKRLAQAVVLQVPTALTKYVVADAGETVIDVPVPITALLQLPAYQFQVAPMPKEPPTTDNVVGFPGQIGFAVALILAGADEGVAIVTDVHSVALFPQSL
jgi:hypothetical protein